MLLFSSSVRKPLGPNGPPGPAILCLPYFPVFLPEAGFFAAAAVFLPAEAVFLFVEAVLPEAGFLAAVEVLPEEAVFFLPEEEAGFLPDVVVSAGVSSPSRDARPSLHLHHEAPLRSEPLNYCRLKISFFHNAVLILSSSVNLFNLASFLSQIRPSPII